MNHKWTMVFLGLNLHMVPINSCGVFSQGMNFDRDEQCLLKAEGTAGIGKDKYINLIAFRFDIDQQI